MGATASFVILASTLIAMVSAQIPERAEWEITFAQVEAAAGLSDLRTAPPQTFEARLMERAGVRITPATPVPFLRLVRSDGAVRAQLFLAWGPGDLNPSRRSQDADIVCRDNVCVKPIDITEQREWGQVIARLVENACPSKDPPGEVSATGGVRQYVKVCPHCPRIWIKTAVDGKYREQVCEEPGLETEAGSLLELMKRTARAGRY